MNFNMHVLTNSDLTNFNIINPQHIPRIGDTIRILSTGKPVEVVGILWDYTQTQVYVDCTGRY